MRAVSSFKLYSPRCSRGETGRQQGTLQSAFERGLINASNLGFRIGVPIVVSVFGGPLFDVTFIDAAFKIIIIRVDGFTVAGVDIEVARIFNRPIAPSPGAAEQRVRYLQLVLANVVGQLFAG